MSVLKPSESVLAAMAVVAVVGGVYMNATPSLADVRVGNAGDPDVDSSRKMAAWTAGAVVAFAALIAKDYNIFISGAGAVVAFDWLTRHANEVDPVLKRAVPVNVAPDSSAEVYDATDG